MAKRKKTDTSSEAELGSPINTAPAGDPTPSLQDKSESSVTDGSAPAHNETATPKDWVSRTHRDDETKDAPDRRPSYPDPNVPFAIAHNNQAGVRFLKFGRFKQVQIAFANPPSDDVHNQLMSEGWKFREEENVYTRQYGPQGEAAALIDGKRTYSDLVDHLLAESGQRRASER
jgi:hypothetical protein